MHIDAQIDLGVGPEDVGLSDDDIQLRSELLDVGDVILHCVIAGPPDGDVVLLLHGFPEFWYEWYEYILPLATAGYRVVVPDQRGYHRSERPDAISAYHPDALATDVCGIIDNIGAKKAHIVGHDWGAFVAWWVALHHPARLQTLSVINVPHPTAFKQTLWRNPKQVLRSWYIGLFQLPRVPEAIARVGNWRSVTAMMQRSSHEGTFDATDFERYRTAWALDGAYEAMINWYRAVVRANPQPVQTQINAPTLLLWGAQDRFLTRSLADASAQYCTHSEVVMFEQATHWVPHEEQTHVQTQLLDHFSATHDIAERT
ncbi:MAG: putative hydrolase or acyltransferases (alpha/beta hydrolase superfamily) [Haloquadratum walsbyi J07HQW1]|jgi:Predicted hydrolases or acyltransferases (alpha/beta hydrolase superfamily)|uniref:Putative hydrolase or acyltransferases (Alpha/beta hydrolase superfamily) n=1 Tax=Haloquadratum walsbyi J07HQW1 TaxID=1238424 RepID=U1PKH2_9EURY|nr:MAG: putative hydrolase or acyltransferases (alpha/beta hydrolase superfamily) [Haloquadratum walsbyi J07HQW1]